LLQLVEAVALVLILVAILDSSMAVVVVLVDK
jgi:hypothetical protein